MSNLQLVPIESYHKATVIALLDNEGEVNWDHFKLTRRINGTPVLINELNKCGYSRMQKSFTAQQVALLFKYISHPILNVANRKLLGIKDDNYNLLANFEQNPQLININDMEQIQNLTDAVLSALGLRKKGGGDLNPHYVFTDNDTVYFMRTEEGFFKMYACDTLKKLKTIKSTDELVRELLRLKNKE